MSAPGPNTPPVSGDEKGFRLEIEVFDPAKTEDIEWAWDGFLPYEMLAILSGESGNGKSLIAIDILARKTSGRSMPLEPERADLPPEKVLYLAREDPKKLLLPRLIAAGVDFNYFRSVPYGFRKSGGKNRRDLLALPQDRDELELLIEEEGFSLVYTDSIMSMIGPGGNAVASNEMRRKVLFPLAEIAERCGPATFGTRHFSKAGSSNARNAGIGSIEFTNVARSNMLVAEHPNNPDVKVIAVTEGSNAVKERRALEYQIVGVPVVVGGRVKMVPKLEWLGESNLRAEDLLVEKGSDAKDKRMRKARALVQEMLAKSGWSQDDLLDEGRERGINPADVLCALEDRGVDVAERDGGPFYSLPLPRSKQEVLRATIAYVTRRVFDKDQSAGKQLYPWLHDRIQVEATKEERLVDGWPETLDRTMRVLREASIELGRKRLRLVLGRLPTQPDGNRPRWSSLAEAPSGAGGGPDSTPSDLRKRGGGPPPRDGGPGGGPAGTPSDLRKRGGGPPPEGGPPPTRHRSPDPAGEPDPPAAELDQGEGEPAATGRRPARHCPIHSAPLAILSDGRQHCQTCIRENRPSEWRTYICTKCGHKTTALASVKVKGSKHPGCPKGLPDGTYRKAGDYE